MPEYVFIVQPSNQIAIEPTLIKLPSKPKLPVFNHLISSYLKIFIMKPTTLKISFIFLFLGLMGAGCDKEDELPPYHAKGKIIAVTSQCYGEEVVIEVENPKELGLSGTFSTIGNQIDISYINAISVPYFSKIGIPDSIPQTVGTWLYFEYRELTEEEIEQNLFSPDPPINCLLIYGSPTTKLLVITKIISYK